MLHDWPRLSSAQKIILAGLGSLAGLCSHTAFAALPPPDRPNFLIIIAEDMGPWLGCYGEEAVHTPNLDAIAARGIRFTQAWASGPACSPSRSSLFTGLWAPSLGTETHREPRPIPDWTVWTQYLRAAGYYATNNAKTDYNADRLHPDWWDESSDTAHYRNRRPGQPFFHVYSSLMQTHMSFLLDYPLDQRQHRTVPTSAARLPAYLPDDTTLLDDRAWHLHGVNLMDGEVGRILLELDRAGEASSTIVIFFSDHGGVMPNAKGYANKAGFEIPLLVYMPPAFGHLAPTLPRPGEAHDGAVSLMDIPRTVFSLANIAPPAHLQGKAIAGPHAGPDPANAPYLFAYRGINGGRWDVVRSLRRGDLIYTRNYLPFRSAGIRQNYHMRMPGQQAYERLWQAQETDPAQSAFWQPRSPEELHNLSDDPEQLENLAEDPRYAAELQVLRRLLDDHLESINDIGFVPNTLRQPEDFPTFYDRMAADHALGAEIRKAAHTASAADLSDATDLAEASAHAVSSVRYWAAVGLTRLAYAGNLSANDAILIRLLEDQSDEVRVMAAEAITAAGQPNLGLSILLEVVSANRSTARAALSAIETLGPRAEPIGEELMNFHTLRADDFYLRSALITLGLLPYDALFR
jgi:uncharacterized sulfatase